MKWMLFRGALLTLAAVLADCSGGANGPSPGPTGISGVFENSATLALASAGGSLTMPAVGIVSATMLFSPPGANLSIDAVTANGPTLKDPGPDVWSGCPVPFQTEILTFAQAATFGTSPTVSLQGVLQTGATWFQYELFDADAPSGTATIAAATVPPGSNPNVVNFPPSEQTWNVVANHCYMFVYISSLSPVLPCAKVCP